MDRKQPAYVLVPEDALDDTEAMKQQLKDIRDLLNDHDQKKLNDWQVISLIKDAMNYNE